MSTEARHSWVCLACGKKDRTARRLETCRTCGGALRNTGTRYYNRQECGAEDGKRVRKIEGSFAKKKEAVSAHVAASQARTDGTWVEPSKLALGQYIIDDWLPAIRATIRPSTFDSYQRNLAIHVIPTLGKIALSKLHPGQLNALYGSLARGERPLAAKTIRYIHTIVHRALKDAQRWGKVARNAAALADPPRPRAPDSMSVWSPAQVRTFLDGVAGERLHPFYLLALTTGMRRGELLGLRWIDVDLEKGFVSIKQTLVCIGYRVEFGEPKTSRSRRTISIDPATIVVLKSYRARQLEERLAWGPGWTDSGLVFAKENGTNFHPSLVSDAFEKAMRRSGLPRLRLHDLRHTYATLALESGMKPWDVSDRIGHSSVAFTLQVYRHAVQATQDTAALAAASYILGP